MSDLSASTERLHDCIDRMRRGDPAAGDDLFRAVGGRLEDLARRMLRRFPNVSRWAETDDVLQGASVRLLRTLRDVRPASARDFFNLAANHLRGELLDLARRFGRRERAGAPPPGDAGAVTAATAPETDRDDLDRWAAFHAAVERLPVAEREVTALAFYHGWSQAEIAELLQVTDRTVRRWWQSACVHLSEQVDGRLPALASPAADDSRVPS
jgi:RNA polymerase sigma-70 factor (ECF subfamily)